MSASQYMQAVRFHGHGGPEVLVCDEVPWPQPGAGEVRVRVEATGINFADVVRRRGDPYPAPSPLPFTPGGECIGVVEQAGCAQGQPWLGRRVFAFPGVGCYAEQVVAPLERVYPVPEGLGAVEGVALFVQGLSAALVLKDSARLQPGDSVLVQGAAGGVGLLGLQLARLYGAGLVIGAASTPAKRQTALDHGADLALDYTAPGWERQVKEATGGRGVDVVMEMTGGEVARASFGTLAPFGRCVVYGAASREPLVVNTETLPPGNLSVTGFWLRGYLGQRERIATLLQALGGHVTAGRLRVHVGGVFALAQAAEAHRALETRSASGKLVLVPG